MNPDKLPQPPSFDLPAPAVDQRPAGSESGSNQQSAESRQPAASELPHMGAPPPLPMTQPGGLPAPVQDNSQANPQAAAVDDPVASDDLPAEDSDLIEKEWVERAKAIVAGTRDDPYRQNKELNGFKADYLKKRYNKDIKVD
jgi:hypothetical protein